MGLIEDFIAEHPKEMELAQMRRRATKKLLADYDKSLREQIEREILDRLPEYTETEACKRAGFYYDRDDVIAAIARERN